MSKKTKELKKSLRRGGEVLVNAVEGIERERAWKLDGGKKKKRRRMPNRAAICTSHIAISTS
ncbi:hypothetical protein RFM26_02840 [Mesorhizobium sp. VK23B]|uniref:Uncharacterized protein n=1 Tax=Mesorhizobium dulcispinae TaxID=3072316 RepID=A0ABU4XA29_9HYPH|nr:MULTISPECIES: hypothetical protein [unclassified Mesorhizobium]MDX8464620.1 hypothetical protein [Mesorhizobium sp. VK23B]MDX8471006.1 hypothetical protein [Mesorhizobium sp. VK23A]